MVCKTSKFRSYLPLAFFFLAGTSSALFGQMLYLGNVGDNTISTYVIDQESGFLTEILPRTPSTGSPSSIATHPSGKFAYVTNGGSAALGVGPSIAVFSIDGGTGALTLASSVSLVGGTGPAGAAIDAAGKFLFVANSGPGNVSVYAIDASTGALSPVPGSPFHAAQSGGKVVVHPSGKFAYVGSGVAATPGQIVAFTIGANGALTTIPGSLITGRNNMVWMAMDPAGKFLFAVERQDNAVLVYSVNATTGALTQVGTPFTGVPGVSGVVVDPAGKYLYASAPGIGAMTVFTIGATGALTQSRNFGSITGAFDTILDPSGKFLYITGQTANAVAGFSLDPNNGAPAPLPQQFFPAGVQPTRGATVLLSPPVLPPISANPPFNYHSHAFPGAPNGGIALGSRMAISGLNIGPGVGASSDFPLKTDLAGVSIQIQSGDVTTAALMVFASNNFVTCVVPSTAPLGPATVTVTYKGRTTAPVPITIVPVSIGIRTLNDQGSGPAQSWIAPPDTLLRPDPGILQTPDTLNQSVKPGQLVIVQATGLGAVSFDETQNLFQELSVPADAIVGNKPAAVIYELRVAQGSDFIVFKVPDDAPAGCYVPVAIRTGGVTSNVASISISATGGSCSDPGGLSSAEIDAAQKSGQIRMGTLALSHLELPPLGTDNTVKGNFARYDAPSLLAAFAPANNGPGIRSSVSIPPLGTCSVVAGPPTADNALFDTPGDPIFPQPLNAGALNLTGPGGTGQLTPPDYRSDVSGGISRGDYRIDNGTGNQVVGAFKAVLNVPAMITWTNKDALTSVDRTQDLTVTWSGGNPDKEFALIAGLSVNAQFTGSFLCTEKVSAGQFTVPAWVLSTVPKSDSFSEGGQTFPTGLVGVGTTSFTDSGRFTAPGLDFGVFSYEQVVLSLIAYQ